MEALLDKAGDPDHKFLLQGEHGFPVGVLKALPRTPHMYEEQTSWKLEDDPYMKDEVWRSNYESVGEHKEFVRQHLEEECSEGLIERLSLQQAKERFGDKIAISSLAVLVEETHGNKKRIIHDGYTWYEDRQSYQVQRQAEKSRGRGRRDIYLLITKREKM